MERIRIGEKLYFQRSDGRVHMVTCIGKNSELELVTGEWSENSVLKGKEVSLSQLLHINPQLFEDKPIPAPTSQAPVSFRAHNASSSLIPKPSFGGGGGGAQAEKSLTGKDLRGLPPTGLPGPKIYQTPPVAAANRSASKGRHVFLGNVRNGSPICGKSQLGNNTSATGAQRISNVVHEVNRMKEERELRRARHAEQKTEKEALRLQDPDNPFWEAAIMMRQYRESLKFNPLRSHNPRSAAVLQITVCVRKRPMSRREEKAKKMDIVTVPTPNSLIVHELRHKVDNTKYLENHKFRFDYTFDETCSNSLVYCHTARPLIRTMFEGGNATCFAYGQTGSGKTHTMGGEFSGKVQDCRSGIYGMAAKDVFQEVSRPEYRQKGAKITCSYFEIYGSKVYDLLTPDKPKLRVLEDGRQQVVVVGLKEMPVTKVDDVLHLIEVGNKMRTSGQTSANAKSSRSHAVFQIALHLPDTWSSYGKCSFVDLAGNERGADTQSADRQTRIEGAEINKSLLALKECIRAMSRQATHLPFRGSKLTQVLRDSFVGGAKNKTCMIAMISPTMNCVEHTLNTLRYADRVKELVAKDEDSMDAYDEYAPPADQHLENLENESEPEMYEEEEIPYDDDDDGNAHGITISSTEQSYLGSNNNNIITVSPSNASPDQASTPRVKIKEVAKQHEDMIMCLENFVQTFKNINSRTNFKGYVRTLERPIHDLATMVESTMKLVADYNSQPVYTDIEMRRNSEEADY